MGGAGEFLDAIRRHEWDASLPTNAALYADDFPGPGKRLPPGLAVPCSTTLTAPE